jgi:hypothetical protein
MWGNRVGGHTSNRGDLPRGHGPGPTPLHPSNVDYRTTSRAAVRRNEAMEPRHGPRTAVA